MGVTGFSLELDYYLLMQVSSHRVNGGMLSNVQSTLALKQHVE
jgi:hypothetical protein